MTTDFVARRGADAPTTTDYLSDAPADLRLNGFLLRLPALGPIVGWTRIEEGQLRARVWIQLDDTGSDLPIAMLTVRCGGGEAEPETAKLWQVFRVESEDADGQTTLGYCGLADLDFESGDPDAAYWVLGVHRTRMPRSSEDEQSAEGKDQAPLPPLPGMPSWALAIAKLKPLPLQSLPFLKLCPWDIKIQDVWVNDPLRYLRRHLAEQDARARAPLRTLSRVKIKTGSPEDSEVRLAAAPRACASGA
ncbi:MAG: hypothetical protein WCA17_02965, partial [Burkholderiales bacterium]